MFFIVLSQLRNSKIFEKIIAFKLWSFKSHENYKRNIHLESLHVRDIPSLHGTLQFRWSDKRQNLAPYWIFAIFMAIRWQKIKCLKSLLQIRRVPFKIDMTLRCNLLIVRMLAPVVSCWYRSLKFHHILKFMANCDYCQEQYFYCNLLQFCRNEK